MNVKAAKLASEGLSMFKTAITKLKKSNELARESVKGNEELIVSLNNEN